MKPQRHRDTEASQGLIRGKGTAHKFSPFSKAALLKLFSVSLCVCGYMFLAVDARAELQAGASRVIITPDQKVFHEAWRGSRIHVVETPEQALRAIGVKPTWTGEMGNESNGLVPVPRRKK